MKNTLRIEIENLRAIKKADIALDGITVIAGENSSGKSTISKLSYHLIDTILNYDAIIEGSI